MFEQVLMWSLTFFLAVSLSACAGLRAFLPLFLVGLAFRFEFGGLSEASGLSWLTSDQALWVLGLATTAEIIGDKIPILDHGLDALGTLIRPLGGAAAVFAAVGCTNPKVALFLSVFLALVITLPVHAVKTGARGVSTVSSGGLFSPLISLFEDVLALVGAVLALLAPVIALVLMIAALTALFRFLKRRASRSGLVASDQVG